MSWVRPCWSSVRTNRSLVTVKQGLFAIRQARALGGGGSFSPWQSLISLFVQGLEGISTLKWNTPCQGVSKFGQWGEDRNFSRTKRTARFQKEGKTGNGNYFGNPNSDELARRPVTVFHLLIHDIYNFPRS